MTTPTAQRCAREGCGKSEHHPIHWGGYRGPDGEGPHAFVSPQEGEAPRPPRNANVGTIGHANWGKATLTAGIAAIQAAKTPRAATLGDTPTPQAPTPPTCCSHCGVKVFATLSNARYQCCGCGTIWTDTEAAPELDFVPATTPPGGPASEPTLTEGAEGAPRCPKCFYDEVDATAPYRARIHALEDDLAAMTKARDLWKQYADANLARTQEQAADLATQAASLAALRCAATRVQQGLQHALKGDSPQPIPVNIARDAERILSGALTETQP